MDDYNPKVVARIKPLLGPAKYFNAEEVPTSVLEYVVYEGVRVWSRYRKQHEIDYLIATVARVKRSKHAYLLEFLKEFWCDSPNGLELIVVHPCYEASPHVDDLLRAIGDVFSRALIEERGSHHVIWVECGKKSYDVDPWWPEIWT